MSEQIFEVNSFEDKGPAKFDYGITFADGTHQITASSGIQGAQGTIGSTGSQGTTGSQGATGSQGTTGAQGVQGTQGIQGVQGTQGVQGAQGTQGTQGVQGLQGIQGPANLNNAHLSVSLATQAVLPNSPTYTHGSTDSAGGTGIGGYLQATTFGALVVDGVTVTSVGQRILVKNQATSTQNGIYTVTTIGSGSAYWKLTRATDYDDSSIGEVVYGDFTLVVAGNTHAGQSWIQYNTGSLAGGYIKIDTDPILFTQTTGTGVQGATGATGAGGVISNYGSYYSTVDQNATTGGEAIKFDSTNIQNGVTLVTNGTALTRITAPVTGTYLIDFAGQLAVTGPGNKQANFWLVKNGTTAVSTAFDSVVTDTTPTIAAWTWQVNATANDYYEVFWNATSTNVFLNAVAAASPVPQASGAVIRMSQINYQGIQGTQGTQGIQGIQGIQGVQGITGSQGLTGTGIQGIQGLQGGVSNAPAYTVTTQTATAGQTTFTVSYIVGYLEVNLNGVRLSSADFTATDGTSVVLATAALAGDILDFVQITLGLGAQGLAGTQGATGAQGVITSASAPSNTDVLWADTSTVGNNALIPAGGTTGQVLAKVSTTDYDTTWNTVAAGGYTQIATGSLSGTSITLSSIPSTYKSLVLYTNDAQTSAGIGTLGLQVNGDTGSNYQYTNMQAGSTSITSGSGTYSAIGNAYASSTGFIITTTIPQYTTTGMKSFNTFGSNFFKIGENYNVTAAINSVTIMNSNAYTFTGGTYTLYGVN